MQQQFQASADAPSTPIPPYSPHLPTPRQRYQREISPWGNGDESRKVYNAAQYFEAFPDPQYQHRTRSTPIAQAHKRSLKHRFPHDFSPPLRTKKSNEGQGIRLNLVTVDLDQEGLPNGQKRLGKAQEGFKGRGEEGSKEQPMRVRIFKRIMLKNQQAEDEYTDRAAHFMEEIQEHSASISLESSSTPIPPSTIYQSMPKRSLRVPYLRSKLHSTLQVTRDGFFPRISAERDKRGQNQFICKGELIPGKKVAQSMRKVSYRSAQLESSDQGEVLFFKKYSLQQ